MNKLDTLQIKSYARATSSVRANNPQSNGDCNVTNELPSLAEPVAIAIVPDTTVEDAAIDATIKKIHMSTAIIGIRRSHVYTAAGLAAFYVVFHIVKHRQVLFRGFIKWLLSSSNNSGTSALATDAVTTVPPTINSNFLKSSSASYLTLFFIASSDYYHFKNQCLLTT